ncbi:MAG TPA: nickel pincer cofactor biosynthesis protein LarC [Vicinamibacterales bacterium]|nr:nickel pincer cofactor biosynthesis protein LarC [Vicinamibacterales bacterium]
MAKTLYFDCFSGASGDMILGALLDLGLPIDDLRAALGSLSAELGEVTATRVLRSGISATKFHAQPDHREHSPQHHHHAHDHHSLKEINALIARSALSPAAKDRAVHLFERLAEAEAAIHEIPVERIHLHEVGAIDSIVDIVGAVHGLEQLRADRIVSSPLNVGGGTVNCAHGVFPVPAPATARLLSGVPVYSGDVQMELVTPTGALIVTGYAESFGPMPPMTIAAIGYGAGDRDPERHPNVMRMIVGDSAIAAHSHGVVEIVCEIDDMNPQLFGPLMDQLHQGGALDVFYAPVQMKKNRPGTLVTVLARPEDREKLSGILFSETTTIGVRYQEMMRECLERELLTVETPVGPVRFKVARRAGRVMNASPEFEDCAKIASEKQLPVKDVQAIVLKAWLNRSVMSD